MEMNGDANGNSISYMVHIQKLFEEYEQLQLEYSRLRQQLNDHVVLPKNDSHYSNENNNRTVDDLRAELECEKAQNKSLRKEVVYLLDQVRRTQKRYNDLMSIHKNDKERPVENDSSGEHKKSELSLKLSQLESENKDLKENIEFITSENAVLTDSLKDLEETLFKERMEWLKEKESHEEVLMYSRNLYDKSKELTAKLAEQEETNNKLKQKYARNRKVWEDNEKKFTAEMDKSDNFIAVLVDTLKKLPENVMNCPELQEMITIIGQNELDKSTNLVLPNS